jgi:hypothetical protein
VLDDRQDGVLDLSALRETYFRSIQ